jgi:type I restriction enzyme S subunit
MSEAWKQTTIAQCLGTSFAGEWGTEPKPGNALVFRATDIDDEGRIVGGGAERRLPIAKLRAKQLQYGDILLEGSGGGPDKPVGRVAYFEGHDCAQPAVCSNFFKTLRPARDRVDAQFLVRKLAWFHKQSPILALQQQTTGIINLKFEEYLASQITIPESIAEQCKIAQILDTLDTAIHETEAIIAKLKAVKQGLMHDLLTRGVDANGELRPPQAEAPHLYKESALGWIPKDWRMQPLGEMAEVSRGKFTHRPRNDPRFYGGRHPFIQTGDVAAAEGEYVSTFSQTLSDRGMAVSQEFPPATIAITIAANIADTAILAIPMFFPDSVVGAVVNGAHNVRFVELSIRRAKRWLDARAPQSAQKNINLQDLRPLLLAVPGRHEQDEIAMRYEAVQSQLQLEVQALEKYREERAGLMDDLLTGRVRVTPLLDATSAA